MLVIATTISGLEECVCREAGSKCLQVHRGLIVFQAPCIARTLSMHSIASIAEIIGVFSVVEPSRRILRLVVREVLYALKAMGKRVASARVWCSDRRVRETLRVIGIREIKRVYGFLNKSSPTLWLVYDGTRLWMGVEIARRIYSRIWVTSAGLNPMVAYCIVSRYADVFLGKKVLEIFAGGATMALEACRLGAVYGVGVEIDENKARLSLENAWKSGLDKCYDVVVADAFNPPFRKDSFSLVIGDPPRGWRFSAVDLDELLVALEKVSKGKIVLVLGSLPRRGRIVGRLRVGGEKIFVVEF